MLSWLSRSIWSHLLSAKSCRDKEYELPSLALAPISPHVPENKRVREMSPHSDSLSQSPSVSIVLSTSSSVEKSSSSYSNKGQGGQVQQRGQMRGQILDLDSISHVPIQPLNDAQPKIKTCKSKAAMMEAKRIKTAQVIAI